MLEQNTMKPLYEQMVDAIRREISNGKYRPGDRLPTEMELESIYNVSRITVRRAIKELCDQRLLIKKQGKGTFVLSDIVSTPLIGIRGFHDSVAEKNADTGSEVLELGETVPSEEMAGYLGIPPYEKVVVLKRLLYMNGAPIMLDHCYLPSRRYPGIMEKLHGDFSVYRILTEEYGAVLHKAEKVIKVRKAKREEAEKLHCAYGDPVFDIFKNVFDEDGVSVHVSISILTGENTSYVISTDSKERLKVKDRQNGGHHSVAQS